MVLPTINEAPNVAKLIPALRAEAEKLGLSTEFIVVDGPSTDGTFEAAEKAGARALKQKGKGYGAALTEGFAASRGEWLLTIDADFSHPPSDLPRFWAAREGHDLVIGSRYCAGGRAEMDLQRQVLSRSLNILTRLWFRWGVRDSSSGFRLYRGSTARAAGPEATARDFSIQQQLLLIVRSGGGRVAEIPFHYQPREAGVSKASALKLLPSYARLLLSGLKG